MRKHLFPGVVGLLALGLAARPGLAQPAPAARGAKPAAKDKPAELPPAPARLWLMAPTATGPWTLRLDNEGERPMRIAADERLLSLEIEQTEVDARGRSKKKKVKCAAPSAMRPRSFPERRALLLPPGHSYIEQVDPHLVCFGKDAAALTGGAVVRAWLGWDPPSKWARKAPEPPFLVESTDDPPAFAPARGLAAPTIVLGYGEAPGAAEPTAADKPAADQPAAAADKPAADKPAAGADQPAGTPAAGAPASAPPAAPAPPPIVDANAPRLEINADSWADAGAPRRVTIGVVAKNVGKRPMTVALLPRMLEFRVEGPDGVVTCPASPATGAVPRDLFRTLKPGSTSSFRVLLGEVCPSDALRRQGLYRVIPTLHANEGGQALELDAYTADVPAQNATRLRLQSAPAPFHAEPPKAVPTPGRAPSPEPAP